MVYFVNWKLGKTIASWGAEYFPIVSFDSLSMPSNILGKKPSMKYTIALSAIDQFAARCYVSILFCFPTIHSDDPETTTSHLKKGLSALAKDHNFLKGRVCPTGSRGYVQVCYDTNDPDPPLVTQPCPSFTYSQLRDSGFVIHSGKSGVFAQSPADCCQAVFAIKVTFIHGGLVLCISPHHSFFDGRGAFRIAEIFATYCRGETMALELGGMYDRLQLLHGDKAHGVKNHDQCLELTTNKTSPQADPSQPGSVPSEPNNIKSLVPVIFSISDHAAKDLRATLFPTKENSNSISRLDGITSLLFARIIKNRCSNVPATAVCSLNTAVDARSRLDPPLSKDYLGNVVIGACLDMPFSEILSKPDDEGIELKQIAAIALTLRIKINAIDDMKIRHTITYVESKPNIQDHFVDTHPEHPEASLMCSSLASWPAYELDFGGTLGRSEAVRAHSGGSGDLKVQPKMGREGDYEVTTVLEKREVEKLKEDGLLGRWCVIRSLE